MPQIGIEIIERTVDIETSCDAKEASPPYFAARMAVVLPAGIPANNTDTPVIRGSTEKSRRLRNAIKGMRNNRTHEKLRETQSSLICERFISPTIEPINIIESGVVQFPTEVMVISMNFGIGGLKNITIKPIYTDTIPGCRAIFLAVTFQDTSEVVKQEIPAVHMTTRWGIR